ncbi:MAG: hypothetical protein OEZ22_00025 [Spirochaetia bacterium]|nr:hypothetical protein [Spirochaetia bacterium]
MIRQKTIFDSLIEVFKKILKPSHLFFCKIIIKDSFFYIFALPLKFFQNFGKKRRKSILAPGKTLIYQPFTAAETILISPFLNLWYNHFNQKVDFACSINNEPASLPVQKHESIHKIHTISDKFIDKFIFFRKNKYNTVILLFPYPFFDIAFLLWFLRVRNRVGIEYLKKNYFLNFSIRFNEYNAHLTYQVKSLFEECILKKINDLPQPFFLFDENKRTEARKLLNSLHVIRFVVCHINLSSIINFNEWPASNLSDFIKLFLEKNRLMHVLLIESKNNKEYLNSVISKIPLEFSRKVHKISGISYDTIYFLLEKSKFFLNLNSPLGHVAAAAKTTIFNIYGPFNEKINQPFSSSSKSIFINIECRPCYKIFHSFKCTNETKNACLINLSGDYLFQFISKNGF